MTARHAWIDATAGVAGDMLLGALVDAGAPLEEVQRAVDAVLPGAIQLRYEVTTRAGQRAARIEVELVAIDVPERRWSTIRDVVTAADLAPRVRDRSLRTFQLLAEAEARVHDIAVEDVHFHEVGALDSIADIVGVAAALDVLQVDTVSASAVAVGSGRAATAHGDLPVPVPAVVQLAADWRIFAGGTGELTTPTGMALLAALSERCEDLPRLTFEASGSGAGSKDVPGRPNLTRVLLGSREDAQSPHASGDAVVLEANVDDLDPRLWPDVLSTLLSAGASDAWLIPITMKKGRPAYTLAVLAEPDRTARLRDVVLTRTSTIGIRETAVTKTALPRGWVDVSVRNQTLPVKIAHRDEVIWQVTPEFEDLQRIATLCSISPAALLAEASAAAAELGLVIGAPLPDGLRDRRAADQS